MEYLHLFKTKTEHDSFYGGNKYKEPWLAYTRDNTLVTGNKSYDYYRNEYLTIEVLDDSGDITITIPSGIDSTCATSLSYSKDKLNWTPVTVDSTDQTISISVSGGDNVYLKGEAIRWGGKGFGTHIQSSANFTASGNIMSLLYGDDFEDKTSFRAGSEYTFLYLFINNPHLINAENLILPATKLVSYCYYSIFYNCTSLTTAPTLPATTLTQQCYSSMFHDCTSLNNITMFATDISALHCLRNWVKGVASTGTFTKASSASIPSGASGIPSGWTVKDK